MKREKASPRRRQPTRAQVERLSPSSIGATQTRAYVAAPIAEFGSKAQRRALRIILDRFPEAEVLDAAVLFADSLDWRRRWPELLRTIDRMIFVSGKAGIIGAGLMQEIVDARLHNISCEYLTDGGTFVPLRDITFQMVPAGSRIRFARVRVSRSR